MITYFLCGSVIVSQLLFFLGLTGMLYKSLLAVLFILGICFFIFTVYRKKNVLFGSLQSFIRFFSQLDRLSTFFLVLIIVSLLSTFLVALYPPFFSDETGYHLLNARKFLKSHIIKGDMEYPYSLFPVSFEMLYMYSMALFTDRIPKLLHWFFHLISLILIYRIARKELPKTASLGAATLFAITPVTSFYASTAFITSGIIAFFLAGFYHLMEYIKKNKNSDLFLASAFSFFLLVMHHSSVMFLISFFVVYLLWSWKKKKKLLETKTLLWLLLLFLLISAPFYLRNLLTTGDPFYPVFSSFLKVKNWNSFVEYSITRQFYFNKGCGRSLLDLLKLPYNLTFHFQKFSTLDHPLGIGPLYFLLIPVLVVFYKKRSSILNISIFIILLIGTIMWFFFMPHFARFIFPLFSLACIPLSMSFYTFWISVGTSFYKKILAYMITITMVINIIAVLQSQSFHATYLLRMVSGQFDEEQFLREVRGPAYVTAWFLNEKVKDKNACVAFFKDFTPYYCDLKSYSFYISPTLSHAYMTDKRISAISKKGYHGQPLYNCGPLSKEELLTNIRKMRIRFLAFNKKEIDEAKNPYLDFILSHCKIKLKLNDYFLYELE